MGCSSSSPEADAKALGEKVKILEKTILAKYLSTEQLNSFASFFSIEQFSDQRVIFTQDAAPGAGQAFYVVAEGEVQLEVLHVVNPAYKPKAAAGGEENEDKDFKVVPHRLLSTKAGAKKTLLTTRHVGEFFGARVLNNEQNNCQATAKGKTTCLKLTKAQFDSFCNKDQKLEQRIVRCLHIGLENALKGLQFLTQIDTAKLQLMAASFRLANLDKDAYLFKRDDLNQEGGNGLHFMLEGEVKVSVLDEHNEEKVVAIVKKDQFFGEVGLVVHLPRTATVQARKRCLFLELSQADFRNFVQIAPEVLEAFREKLDDYNIPLRYLVYNPILQKYLAEYMKDEKSGENISFWIRAKNFRLSEKEGDALREEAVEIINEFIKSDASQWVNLIGTTQKDILAALKGNAITRFKQHAKFQQCLNEMTSQPNYKPKTEEEKKKEADAKKKKELEASVNF